MLLVVKYEEVVELGTEPEEKGEWRGAEEKWNRDRVKDRMPNRHRQTNTHKQRQSQRQNAKQTQADKHT